MSVTEIDLVPDPKRRRPFMLSVPEVSETVSVSVVVDEMPVSARVTPLTTTEPPAVTDSVEGSVTLMAGAALTVTAVLPEALVEPELAAKEMVSDPAEAPAV